MNETQGKIWIALKRGFDREFPEGAMHRVENVLARGMPDVVSCVNGVTIWIELKTWKDDASPLQVAWASKWQLAGGQSVILRAGQACVMVQNATEAASWPVGRGVYREVVKYLWSK